MSLRRASPRWEAAALTALALSASAAWAQDTPTDGAAPSPGVDAPAAAPSLRAYVVALREAGLHDPGPGTREELRALLDRGEAALDAGRPDAAALPLALAVESPRFDALRDSPEARAAELVLARAYLELGALRSARRAVSPALERGVADRWFAPAYRLAVDIGLAAGDLSASVAWLDALGPAAGLPEDARNELAYLRGRARWDAGDAAAAREALAGITRRSRFHAPATYLLGALDVREGDLGAAEGRLCRVANAEDVERFTFFVDERFFAVRDLTWLALGRLAHEAGRADDAFYYYFQVPNDSVRVEEALFESAWAMYEGGDAETAVDLLDQLDTRFPASPYAVEAALLRGYLLLERCRFEEARERFDRVTSTYEPLLAAVDGLLDSPARRVGLANRMRAADRSRGVPAHDVEAQLFDLLRVDADFRRLQVSLRTLDAEAARAGRLRGAVAALGARLAGDDAPRAHVSDEDADWSPPRSVEVDEARAVLSGLTGQLDTLRAAGASTAELEEAEAALAAAADRLDRLGGAIPVDAGPGDGARPPDAIAPLLEADRALADALPARVASLRSRLVAALEAKAVERLAGVRQRLAGTLRRARIGRIDAIMGSKRRIERQIESLAAGRFPPELFDPLRLQGLLRDDEEYWPYDGEWWTDEFDETEPVEALSEAVD